MGYRVTGQGVTINGTRYGPGELIAAPDDDFRWMIGTPYVEATEEATPEPPAPVMTAGAAKLAAEWGLDATQIPGTGAGGRITQPDVEAYLEAAMAEAEHAAVDESAAEPIGVGASLEDEQEVPE